MSTLYAAERHDDGLPAVLKVLRPSLAASPKHLARFHDEGAAGERLHHRNVVRTIDRSPDHDAPWIALERLHGVTLADLMTSCAAAAPSAPFSTWAWAVARAADGLDAIHELSALGPGEPAGLVHGDVSPRNLFVTVTGDVVVLDLGLVRRPGDAAASPHPSGTLAYLAPERVDGGHVDRRADLFALGVVLYEATTLRRLQRGADDATTLERVRHHRVRPPHLLVPAYPRALEAVVLRCLRREPAGRFATARDLAAALDRFVAASGALADPQADLAARASTLRRACEDAPADPSAPTGGG
jgi:serine/threonine-protein kinase